MLLLLLLTRKFLCLYISERTGNIPLFVTYNVTMEAGILKQTNNTAVDVHNTAKFGQMLKTGIYKSLCAEGIISNRCLMELLRLQGSEKL